MNTATLYESMSDYVLSLMYADLAFCLNHEFDDVRSEQLFAELDAVSEILKRRGRTLVAHANIDDGTVRTELGFVDGVTPW